MWRKNKGMYGNYGLFCREGGNIKECMGIVVGLWRREKYKGMYGNYG